jgi:CRISPR-associated protein Cas2
MMLDRLNQYRIMWLLVFWDLPTETALERKAASAFRKKVMQDGFNMFQFSIYTRHCASKENMEVHKARIRKILPAHGHVGLLPITDKQFGDMEIYIGRKPAKPDTGPQQLELW